MPAGWAQNAASTNVRAVDLADPMFLSFAKFKIPFNVEARNSDLAQLQLWVSTDAGQTWQLQGSAEPKAKSFDFKAAAEGMYYFSVQTVDAQGMVFPSQNPPLKVLIDTTDPQAAIKADTDVNGQLVVDIRVFDEYLDVDSPQLKVRTDREPEWRDVAMGDLVLVNDIYAGQVRLDLPRCREVGLVLSVADKAKNTGEATFKLTMPRTASGDNEMKLASTGLNGLPQADSNQSSLANSRGKKGIAGAPVLPGAIAWQPWEQESTGGTADRQALVELKEPGRLATNTASNSSPRAEHSAESMGSQRSLSAADQLTLQSSLGAPQEIGEPSMGSPGIERQGFERQQFEGSGAEELPMPRPVLIDAERSNPAGATGSSIPTPDQLEPVAEPSTIGRAFHCKSRAFSLDYSVDALGGSSLADVELWGTEDGGRTWQQWGSDPDRQSPFDVQVGNDGLFGFRMVIVGANGLVSNRPKDGDSADVWINVDTSVPTAKITRAVYGEGPEDGMLVIDYQCQDGHLVERPVTLSFSESIDGPWTTIATGQKNKGIYLWKADPNLPDRIYVRLEAVDKAGNIGMHRLDLPIDTKGLAPRGRIQGFRPILTPGAQNN